MKQSNPNCGNIRLQTDTRGLLDADEDQFLLTWTLGSESPLMERNFQLLIFHDVYSTSRESIVVYKPSSRCYVVFLAKSSCDDDALTPSFTFYVSLID